MNTPDFTIADVISIPNGTVICVVNPRLDALTEAELVDVVGKRLRIEILSGKIECDVTGVQFSTSLVGCRNVFIIIPLIIVQKIVGSPVFKIV